MGRRCAGTLRMPPSWRNKTDARTPSKRSRLFCGVTIVILPAGWPRAKTGPAADQKICKKRQFGIVAKVIFPAEVTMYAEKMETAADKLDRAPRRQRGLG